MLGGRLLPARVVVPILLLLAVTAAGVVAYVFVEGWSWFDALYMTVTTITTLGGGEPRPLTQAGRVLTLVIVVLGLGATTITFLAIFQYLIEGHLGSAVNKRRVRERLRAMKEHFILCGYGRVGHEIAREWKAEHVSFVVIDVNQASLLSAAAEGYPIVEGNANDVEVLREAGIERARGLIAATDNDADNVYVTLSARVMRPDLFIVARANQDDSQAKLKLAGANRIISPYNIGGRRMASVAMRPTAVEFVDRILQAGSSELLLEDIAVPSGSRWAGQTLGALVGDAREAIILALKRKEAMTFRPTDETLLEVDDEIVVAGPREAVLRINARL